jgi:hypothetical protein
MTAPALARCTGDGACPVRFRTGPPRRCLDHADDGTPTMAVQIQQWTDVLQAAPGYEDNDERTTP